MVTCWIQSKNSCPFSIVHVLKGFQNVSVSYRYFYSKCSGKNGTFQSVANALFIESVHLILYLLSALHCISLLGHQNLAM